MPRDIYDCITEDPVPWKVARGKFESVVLVDLRRLIAGPEVAEPAAKA